jgi:hypothetical protein
MDSIITIFPALIANAHLLYLFLPASLHAFLIPLPVAYFSPCHHHQSHHHYLSQLRHNTSISQHLTSRMDHPLRPIWQSVDLFSLRQTSFRLRKIISRSLIYKSIIRCTLPLYHAILGTRHARRVLLIDFWEKLTTMWYDHCENFAMLINIPDWSRICQSCVERGSRINNRLTGTFRVCQYVKLDTLAQWLAEGETLPPWVWRESVGLKGQRQDLVEYDSVRHLDTGKRRSWKRLAPFNYMVASAVPYMDPQTDENESGVACKGSIPQSQRRREDGIRKVYSREEFLEHFQWCNRAQLLWQAYCQPDSRIPIDTTSYTEIQRAIDSVQTNG